MNLIDNINDFNNLYSLTWSQPQDAFHIEKLSNTLKRGFKACMNNQSSQCYIMVSIGSRKDMSTLADKLREQKIKPNPKKEIPLIPNIDRKNETKYISKKITRGSKKSRSGKKAKRSQS